MSGELEFLNNRQAAKLLGLSPWTLVKWRSLKKGPPYVKFGGLRVRYRRAELLQFVAENTIQPASHDPTG